MLKAGWGQIPFGGALRRVRKQWRSISLEGRAPSWVKVIVLVVGTYRLLQLATRWVDVHFGRAGGDWFFLVDLLILAGAIGLGFLVLRDEFRLRNDVPRTAREDGYRDGYNDGTKGIRFDSDKQVAQLCDTCRLVYERWLERQPWNSIWLEPSPMFCESCRRLLTES